MYKRRLSQSGDHIGAGGDAMKTRPTVSLAQQTGFTLVELMISLVSLTALIGPPMFGIIGPQTGD